MNLFSFAYAPKQTFPPGFYHYPQGRLILPIPPEQHFLKILPFFFAFFHTAILSVQKEVGEDYVVEKLPKLTSALVTSFDKFHHLCNLYIFGLCFVVQ